MQPLKIFSAGILISSHSHENFIINSS